MGCVDNISNVCEILIIFTSFNQCFCYSPLYIVQFPVCNFGIKIFSYIFLIGIDPRFLFEILITFTFFNQCFCYSPLYIVQFPFAILGSRSFPIYFL